MDGWDRHHDHHHLQQHYHQLSKLSKSRSAAAHPDVALLAAIRGLLAKLAAPSGVPARRALARHGSEPEREPRGEARDADPSPPAASENDAGDSAEDAAAEDVAAMQTAAARVEALRSTTMRASKVVSRVASALANDSTDAADDDADNADADNADAADDAADNAEADDDDAADNAGAQQRIQERASALASGWDVDVMSRALAHAEVRARVAHSGTRLVRQE